MAGLYTRTVLFCLFVGLLVYVVLLYVYPYSFEIPVFDPRAPNNRTNLVPRRQAADVALKARNGESFKGLIRDGQTYRDVTEETSIAEEQEEPTNNISVHLGGKNLSAVEIERLRRMVGELKVLSYDVAMKTGAFCLDGSTPPYYFRPGSGSGARSWIVFLRGGEGCISVEDCYLRSLTAKGNGKQSKKYRKLTGILLGDPDINPEFHNWNGVSLVYCDGFSFAGNRDTPMSYDGKKLYFRGRSVLEAVFRELLHIGMAAAERLILFGHSAGGLGILLNAHRLKRMIPPGVDFKILISSVLQPSQFPSMTFHQSRIETLLQMGAQMHNISGTPPEACLRDNPTKEWACLLPYNLVAHQPTDVFYINAIYDKWPLDYLLHVKCTPNSCGDFEKYKLSLWSNAMMEQVPRMLRPNDGYFLANCGLHMIALDDVTWFSTKVERRTIAEAFGDWYFGRGQNHTYIDCGILDCYPNPTCV